MPEIGKLSRHHEENGALDKLRPFEDHGVSLIWDGKNTNASGTCPFCGREGKFFVGLETGGADCKTCGFTGGPYPFIRQVWEDSDKATAKYGDLSSSKGFLYEDTPMHWGAARSFLTGEWLLPGYNCEGKLTQLYRYVRIVDRGKPRMILCPTSGLSHGLLGLPCFSLDKPEIYLAEGPWDGMALWEVCKDTDASVLAVPTATVFQESWAILFADKVVTLLFDNDWSKEAGGKANLSGFKGMKRVAGKLSGAKEVRYLRWGEGGFDKSLPDGYDIRDLLRGASDALEGRSLAFVGLTETKVAVAPKEWTEEVAPKIDADLTPIRCERWQDLERQWMKAMSWRRELGDVLSAMVAVGASTEKPGDQLFLQVIGDAGSGKTRMCDGMLVSKKCFPLEHLTGFHSGWKDAEGNDYSLIARCNLKTLITPEGDVLMSNPKFDEIMSQQRRIFDGASGASYKNRKEDLRYTNLRTPWIVAGTPALLGRDQSRLGDRFLRVHILGPTEDEKDDILNKVWYTAIRCVRSTKVNGATFSDEEMEKALRMTGGYVDWLRDNIEELTSAIEVDHGYPMDYCKSLAKFTAYLRARPDPDTRKEVEAFKEMPTRLLHQFARLAVCLAAVLNKSSVDDEVLRRVCKVAVDTARGRTLNLCNFLHKEGQRGLELKGVSVMMGETEDKTRPLLTFLRNIGAVTHYHANKVPGISSKPRYRLSADLSRLFEEIIGPVVKEEEGA